MLKLVGSCEENGRNVRANPHSGGLSDHRGPFDPISGCNNTRPKICDGLRCECQTTRLQIFPV